MHESSWCHSGGWYSNRDAAKRLSLKNPPSQTCQAQGCHIWKARAMGCCKAPIARAFCMLIGVIQMVWRARWRNRGVCLLCLRKGFANNLSSTRSGANIFKCRDKAFSIKLRPVLSKTKSPKASRLQWIGLVDNTGLEPVTSRTSTQSFAFF